MREISYKILPGFGPRNVYKTGNTSDLLRDILRFHPDEDVHDLKALNVLFSKGIIDCGMSGGIQWTPLRVKQDEFNEIRSELDENPTRARRKQRTSSSLKRRANGTSQQPGLFE